MVAHHHWPAKPETITIWSLINKKFVGLNTPDKYCQIGFKKNKSKAQQYAAYETPTLNMEAQISKK